MSHAAKSDQPIDDVEAPQRKLERLEAEYELLRSLNLLIIWQSFTQVLR